MSRRPEEYYQQPTQADFITFKQRNDTELVQKTDYGKFSMDLLHGKSRLSLKTPTDGDTTLLLAYNKREGYVTSWKDDNKALTIVQFQGAKQEGYRVSASLYVVALYAEQLRIIAEHPESPYDNLIMPTIVFVNELANIDPDRIERAMKRYEQLAALLNMQFSQEDRAYVKKVQKF